MLIICGQNTVWKSKGTNQWNSNSTWRVDEEGTTGF